MEVPILRTGLFSRNFTTLLAGIVIVFSLAAIAFWRVFFNVFTLQDWVSQLWAGILALMGLLLVYFIYRVFGKTRTYEIYNDKIRIYNIWRRLLDEIPVSGIRSWTEQQVTSSKGPDYSIFTIYCRTYKIVIDSDSSNKQSYQQVKELVSGLAPENKKEEMRKDFAGMVIFSVFLWIGVALLLYNMLVTWYSGLNSLNPGRFESENYVLTQAPELINNKNGTCLKLYLASPPDKKETYAIIYNGKDPEDEIYAIKNDPYSTDYVMGDAGYDSVHALADSSAGAPLKPLTEEKTVTIKDYTLEATHAQQMVDSLSTRDVIYVNTITPVHTGALEKIFGSKEPYICGISFDDDEKYLTFKDFMAARRKTNLRNMYILTGVLLLVATLAVLSVIYLRKEKSTIEEMPDVGLER